FVRAYTSWMLNFDSTLLYAKPLQIMPTGAAAKKVVPPTVASYSVTLFPEGGDMVENVSSRVAFKANDQDAVPIFIKGDIVTESGKKVTTFTAVHDGMGFFSITPLPGEKYKAVWKDKK